MPGGFTCRLKEEEIRERGEPLGEYKRVKEHVLCHRKVGRKRMSDVLFEARGLAHTLSEKRLKGWLRLGGNYGPWKLFFQPGRPALQVVWPEIAIKLKDFVKGNWRYDKVRGNGSLSAAATGYCEGVGCPLEVQKKKGTGRASPKVS